MDVVQYTSDRLVRYFGSVAGVTAETIDIIEADLGVKLPPDVKPIAAVFRGGKLGELDHFSWSPRDPDNVVKRTEELRLAGLPPQCVAFGFERDRVRAITTGPGHPFTDAYRLADVESLKLKKPVKRSSSGAFIHYHEFILDRLDAAIYAPVRAAMDEKYADLTPRAAKKWRHRFDRAETERICEMLSHGGIGNRDSMEQVVLDGVEYVDLRGLTKDGSIDLNGGSLERVDLSFAEAAFWNMNAKDCRFRGAHIGCVRGRYESCDFTVVQGEGAFREVFLGDFVDCSFVGARLRDCSLGGSFVRCHFTGADLALATPRDDTPTTFQDCIWRDARFSGHARHFDAMRDHAK